MKKNILRKWSYTNRLLQFCGTATVLVMSSLWVNYTACHRSHQSYCVSDIETYFAPEDPCIERIVSKILSAKELVLVQAYVITSKDIVAALITAHQNKVQVKLLVDKNAPTSRGSKIDLLLGCGIPIIIDKTTGFSHNKIMIIDHDYVITGSFNWSHSAQTKNSENIVIIRGRNNNRKFKENWYKRAASGILLQKNNKY